MAADTRGTAHLFGMGGTNGNGFTLTNVTLTAVNLTKAYEMNLTTTNEAGVVVETRRDSRSYKGTVEGFMKSGYTVPALGSLLAVTGLNDNDLNRNYEIVSVPIAHTAGDKIRLTLTVEAHEGITYS